MRERGFFIMADISYGLDKSDIGGNDRSEY